MIACRPRTLASEKKIQVDNKVALPPKKQNTTAIRNDDLRNRFFILFHKVSEEYDIDRLVLFLTVKVLCNLMFFGLLSFIVNNRRL